MTTTAGDRPGVRLQPAGRGSRSGIDPRIQARRIEVQRHNGRRRLRRVVDVALLVAVVAGFVVALRSPLLDVDRISVTGATQTGDDAVFAAAGLAPGQQLMDLDLGAAGERVAALPWVDDVAISRGLNGHVHLEVRERTAVAVAGEGGAAVLLDRTGRVLGPADGAEASLVHLEGIDPGIPGAQVTRRALPALAVAAAMDDRLREAVVGIGVGDDGLVVRLADGGTARLGDDGRLAAKLRSLSTVLERVDLRCLATIDLRAPGSPVLTREPGCS